MRVWWRRTMRPTGGEAIPLEPSSMRLLVAGAVGVLIWLIWLTGTLGDSHRVTMLALSAVSILGLGLVLELRRRFVAEEGALDNERRYRFLTEHSVDMIVRVDPRTQKRTYISAGCRPPFGHRHQEGAATSPG